MSNKEVKKETDRLGNEKWVIYKDGKKVGESKQETGFLGDKKLVTYDTEGRKVSETKHEKDWLQKDVDRTYDTSGRKISETRHETNLLGEPKDVIYEGGRKIGELERRDGFSDIIFDSKRKVLHEAPDHDVDLTRRAIRKGGEKSMSQTSSGDYENWGSERFHANNPIPLLVSRTSTTAVISLIFGIASWTVFPFLGSIVAIICGHIASGEIKRGRGLVTGKGMATAGLILGYLAIAYGICILCLIVILPYLGVDLSIPFLNTNPYY
jgi:hypothetical protein